MYRSVSALLFASVLLLGGCAVGQQTVPKEKSGLETNLSLIHILSVLFYRPFCKWLCPLGAFYALFNRVSLFQMKVDKNKCVSCGKCAKACKMDVDVTKTPNHPECIRCGMCIRACPTNAVCFRYGFGDGKEKENAATLRENNNKA